MSIIRPIEIPVTLNLAFRSSSDRYDCPPPSPSAVAAVLVKAWQEQRVNGLDPSPYTVRSIVESRFSNMEMTTFHGGRDNLTNPIDQKVDIAFIEIASLSEDNITVTIT